MPTLAELHQVDCLGFARIDVKQLKAMVDMLKRTGKLDCPPPACHGSGIVIAGGGRYLNWAWCVASWLRKLGCQLPIQVWFLGPSEMPSYAKGLFAKLDVETVDTLSYLPAHPHRMLSRYVAEKKWTLAGWVSKNVAIEHCPFDYVLYLDSDCFPAVNPEILFDNPQVKAAGIFAFSDICNHAPTSWPWVYFGITRNRLEWECGQYFVHKRIGWMGLRWANWANEHADTLFSCVHGDKGSTELAFRTSGVPCLVSTENAWCDFGISQRWNGTEYFRHSMNFKRGEGSAPWPEVQELFWEWEGIKK